MTGNLQVRFLEGWALAMAPGHSANWFCKPADEKNRIGLSFHILEPPLRRESKQSSFTSDPQVFRIGHDFDFVKGLEVGFGICKSNMQ